MPAPYADDRMKPEEIIIRATRTKAPKEVDLAKRALARFREK